MTEIENFAKFQGYCRACRSALSQCYCKYVKSFDPKIRFVILIHRKESKKRIATGRMSHLFLKHSKLISDYEYTHDAQVNEILSNPRYYPVVLYPGSNSVHLDQQSPDERATLFPMDRELVVFVIDGTWDTAAKMLRRSSNLQKLPRICFTPPHPSRFRVRKQPQAHCFSTIEAIHQTIELVGPGRGYDIKSCSHNQMLETFDLMVDQHIELAKLSPSPRFSNLLTDSYSKVIECT